MRQKCQCEIVSRPELIIIVGKKTNNKSVKTESVQPSRMTIGIFCYRHPSFMMRQDASMGRFDAISRFPAAVVRTMPPTVTGISKFCPKIKGFVA